WVPVGKPSSRGWEAAGGLSRRLELDRAVRVPERADAGRVGGDALEADGPACRAERSKVARAEDSPGHGSLLALGRGVFRRLRCGDVSIRRCLGAAGSDDAPGILFLHLHEVAGLHDLPGADEEVLRRADVNQLAGGLLK